MVSVLATAQAPVSDRYCALCCISVVWATSRWRARKMRLEQIHSFNPRHHRQCDTNLQDTLSWVYLFARYLLSVSDRHSMHWLETFTDPFCSSVCLLRMGVFIVDRRIPGASAGVQCCSPPCTGFRPLSSLILTSPRALRLVRSTAQSFATPFVPFLFLKELCETELKSFYQRKEILLSDFWAYNQPM